MVAFYLMHDGVVNYDMTIPVKNVVVIKSVTFSLVGVWTI